METKTLEETIGKWTRREVVVPPKAKLPEFVNDWIGIAGSRQYAGLVEDVLCALYEEVEYQADINTDRSEGGNYAWNVKPYEDALKTIASIAGINSDQLKTIVYDKKYHMNQERRIKNGFFGHF